MVVAEVVRLRMSGDRIRNSHEFRYKKSVNLEPLKNV